MDYKQQGGSNVFANLFGKKKNQLKSQSVSDAVLLSLIVTLLRPELFQNKFLLQWLEHRLGRREPGIPQNWRSFL